VKNGYVKRYSGNYEEYVYFLSEKIEQDLLQQAQVEKELNKPKPAAIDRKKVRAGLRNIEKELKKAEKEKKQLEVEFADSANAFSVEKKRRYKELEDLIDNLEAQWISEQEQLAGA